MSSLGLVLGEDRDVKEQRQRCRWQDDVEHTFCFGSKRSKAEGLAP